jgi:UDP-glucose 4-epimerase
MEAMRDVGVKRVVFTSSGAVYGSQREQPLKESMRPAPDSPYAVSKLAAEYYVKTIGSLWGIETVTLRIFNAFGPGQRIPSAHPPVIANFLKQAVQEGTLVIHNSGSQARDYVYVDDVVQALVSASTASEVNGEVINVGSGKEVSVIDLADRILELTGAKAEVIHNPKATGGVKHMRADLNKAYTLLKYQPRVSLRQGLINTLETDPRYQV